MIVLPGPQASVGAFQLSPLRAAYCHKNNNNDWISNNGYDKDTLNKADKWVRSRGLKIRP